MFNPPPVPKYHHMIEAELESTIRNLKSHVTGSEDYVRTLTCVERLHELMDEKPPSRVSSDVRATIAANLIGIFMIIKHENVNVITSKAMSFVTRVR